MFRRGEGIGGPVEGVAAVVDCATRFGRVVYRAQVLPLGSAHLWTGQGRTRWVVCEEGGDDGVDFLYEEAAELI